MGMTRTFRELIWTLTLFEDRGVSVHVACVSGEPVCGADPEGAEDFGVEAAEAWTEHHFRRTGHRRYLFFQSFTKQWDPPPGTTIPGPLWESPHEEDPYRLSGGPLLWNHLVPGVAVPAGEIPALRTSTP